jgi:hypothetical protein
MPSEDLQKGKPHSWLASLSSQLNSCTYHCSNSHCLLVRSIRSSLNSNRKIRERKGKERSIFIYDIPRLPDLPTSFWEWETDQKEVGWYSKAGWALTSPLFHSKSIPKHTEGGEGPEHILSGWSRLQGWCRLADRRREERTLTPLILWIPTKGNR